MTHKGQIALVQSRLAGSPSDWQLKVFSLINDVDIPPGHLISYGNLARWANHQFGLQLRPRNTAWLRGKIYHILTSESDHVLAHATDIPIHRVANEGDLKSTKDHEYTQKVNHEKRSAEGSRYYPVWIVK